MYDLKNGTDTQKAIESVADYLKELGSAPQDGVVLYRGHGGEGWKLTPSAGRLCVKGKLLDCEKALFLNFKRQYYLYADDRPATDVDILFLAQHHGLPTRLLDWTYNPLIALWFACQEAIEKEDDKSERKLDGCVYMTIVPPANSSLEEGHQLDNDVFDEKNQMPEKHHFIAPDCTNRRYLNQKGMFIWFKNPATEFKDFSKKILIKEKCKKNILRELATLGVTKAFVLPTLDNLCSDIKTQYTNENNA